MGRSHTGAALAVGVVVDDGDVVDVGVIEAVTDEDVVATGVRVLEGVADCAATVAACDMIMRSACQWVEHGGPSVVGRHGR